MQQDWGIARNVFPKAAYQGPRQTQVTIEDLLTVRYGPHDAPVETPARITRRHGIDGLTWCLVEWETKFPPIHPGDRPMTVNSGLWFPEDSPGMQTGVVDIRDRPPAPKGRQLTLEEGDDDV